MADLREVFRDRRCFDHGVAPLYPFTESRKWILEANQWASHRLSTMIAAILLREYVGYAVDLNILPSQSKVYHRAALSWSGKDGDAVAEALEGGDHFGYANMEVWPAGKQAVYSELANHKQKLRDFGPVGYEGRSGWFIPRAFAKDPQFPLTPEFYRAYDTRQSVSSDAVLRALKEENSIDCSDPAVVTSETEGWTDMDKWQGLQELRWCPRRTSPEEPAATRLLPAVLASAASTQGGYLEEVARANGFSFAVRFLLNDTEFSRVATEAFQRQAAQVVHHWRPSTFNTRLDKRNFAETRIVLPGDHCDVHNSNGTGTWSCDFPLQVLGKITSTNVQDDPVARAFFQRFSIPDERTDKSTSLAGAGMIDLLAALADPGMTGDDENVFDVACQWIQRNHKDGIDWSLWIKQHDVPWYANELIAWYENRLPGILVLILVGVGYVMFLESPWLRTTLSRAEIKRIWKKLPDKEWRTVLETRLRKQADHTPLTSTSARDCTVHVYAGDTVADESPVTNGAADTPYGEAMSPRASFKTTVNDYEDANLVPSLSHNYWEGLASRVDGSEASMAFWQKVEEWHKDPERQATSASPSAGIKHKDYVRFAHHTIPVFQILGEALVPLWRSDAGVESETSVTVSVAIEDCGGGAKAKTDFQGSAETVEFAPGQKQAILRIPLVHHTDIWENSYWFQARLESVQGDAVILSAPEVCTILILDDDTWPANIPQTSRGGMGISLMRYFIREGRLRRKEKWWKTLTAMVWLPVHSVFVSTLVQKVLVDHAAKGILSSDDGIEVHLYYTEVVVLCLIQLFSLGLNRWADVVQTKNRGRTGGFRQVYRAFMLRKFLNLEHAEYWEASDANWLYSAIYDADVITAHAYFQVFVMAQSLFALTLSLFLVLGLALWSYARSNSGVRSASMQILAYMIGVFLIIPLGLIGVWYRRKLTWSVVIRRKDDECAWFKAATWIFHHWRHYFGLTMKERTVLEKRILKYNSEFVPSHWDARDTMNDTTWVNHWIQGITYCGLLLFGTFALAEYQKYGIGSMEVGTFYALCKIYLVVGKYVGRLGSVFVSMQRAVVSLREIAALLNMPSQRGRRREAVEWAELLTSEEALPRKAGGCEEHRRCSLKAMEMPTCTELSEAAGIVFDDGVCFFRPPHNKRGMLFGEFRLRRGCALPLGRFVHVSAMNERVICSFLGMAAKIVHPMRLDGSECVAGLGDPVLRAPHGLQMLMVPSVPTGIGWSPSSSVMEHLAFAGAPKELCKRLAKCVGLEPKREMYSLSTGASQVLAIAKAILLDPDVLITCRPLALVPDGMRPRVAQLLRLWQAGGGLPYIASLFDLPPPSVIQRSSYRTLIVGNANEEFGVQATDVRIALDELLWKEDLDAHPYSENAETMPPVNIVNCPTPTSMDGDPKKGKDEVRCRNTAAVAT
eukprot:TRINITY_DN44946_c0_g1_i3.p1 TRINITY_DN44946_c0_g1~~TRINITY_DN44946_c0_g1_i3.p1  ORF type:complete len:1420 (-),score=271.01 TRINITY_DN44946_c0_g1_i3:124-4383(-)